MSSDLLLGIDVGTTYCKAAVVTVDGAERSHGRVLTPWRTVPSGAEIEAADLTAAALDAARKALARAPEGRVVAIGVTSMAETGILLDAAGESLVPCIAWHDLRGDEEAEEMARSFGDDGFYLRTGLHASRLCSLAKYAWMRAHWPATKRGVRWLNVSEWIVRSLGGGDVAEYSLASRTGLLDVQSGELWNEAFEWSGAPPDLLPQLAPAGAPAGRSRAAMNGIDGAVLTVAGHDHLCAAVGAGAARPGVLFDSCGTAEAFVRAVEPPLSSKDFLALNRGGITIGHNVVPDTYALVGGVWSGLAMRRFLGLLGIDDERARAELDAAAVVLPLGAEGVSIEDVLDEPAAVVGIPRTASPAHIWRATLEAVQRLGAGMVEVMESVVGPRTRLVVTGGGARSEAVCEAKRAILGSFDRPPVEEAGARGAALIGGVAAGIYAGTTDVPDPRSATCGTKKPSRLER